MEIGEIPSEQKPTPRPPEIKVREKLSDEELGNLISAIGNHEAKAITLGLMKPGTIYSVSPLRNTVIQAQGDNIGWAVHTSGPFRYCQDSLAPIGLVAQEIINPDMSIHGYVKTEYGRNIGDPLVGLLLDFSLKYPDYSLTDFFSVTTSSSIDREMDRASFKKRSPTTRIKLFWEILTLDLPVREIDLAKRLKEDPANVGNHLFNLSDAGIISYDVITRGKPRTFYLFSGTDSETEPTPVYGYKPLTSFVWQVFKNNPDKEWTIELLIEEYKKALVKEIKLQIT